MIDNPHLVPKELDVWGIYLPPLTASAILGTLAMILTAYLLNRYRLSRFFVAPQLVFIAVAAIYTCFIGKYLIPS